ncbi:hypothetical protein ACJX0J_034724, partial [Zea mays]
KGFLILDQAINKFRSFTQSTQIFQNGTNMSEGREGAIYALSTGGDLGAIGVALSMAGDFGRTGIWDDIFEELDLGGTGAALLAQMHPSLLLTQFLKKIMIHRKTVFPVYL